MEEEEDEGGGGAGWIVSYADLMTLLFAAFVVLYGLKPEGQSDSVLGVTSNIREAFVEIPDKIPEEQKRGPVKQGKFAFAEFKRDSIREPLLKKFRRTDSIMVEVTRDKAKVEVLLDQMSKKDDGLHRSLRQAVNVDDDERGFTIRFQAAYFYKPGDYRLTRDGRKRLVKVGKLLKETGREIFIEGHTDSKIAKGQFSNYEIGALRAGFAARVLLNDVNISPHLIRTATYADTRPIANNKEEEGRRQNRRIEIKVRYD